jgi:FkbM family methyltransferase
MYYSQCEEDTYLNTHFFKNKKNGVYIEVGAFDGVMLSNSKFFEDTLNWSGILIEPHPNNFKLLQANRPNNYLFNDLVSCHSEPLKYIYFLDALSILSGVENILSHSNVENDNSVENNELIKSLPQNAAYINITPKTLTEIVKTTNLTHIDLLSLDVVCYEYEVLKSWDFSIPIDVILIKTLDAQLEKEELCRQILLNNNYKFITKYKLNEIFVLNTFVYEQKDD